MPRPIKGSHRKVVDKNQIPVIQKSHQAQSKKFFFQSQPSSAQVMPHMNLPYIEGPQMDWTVNDELYNRFHKQKLKCENILECELVMLPEARKCKKVMA